jgi:hypothetical protein
MLARFFFGLIGVGYIATSALVAINGFVWTPTLPSVWYRMQDILYWPFQPYFDLMLRLLGEMDMPYSAYALVTRVPFLILGLVLLIAVSRRSRRRRGYQR